MELTTIKIHVLKEIFKLQNRSIMKKILFIFAGLSILLLSTKSYCSNEASDNQTAIQTNKSNNGTININCTQELQNLATNLIAEYGKLKPEVKITITDINHPSVSSEKSFSLVSGEFAELSSDETAWKILVGREVIVPVTNSRNPLLEEITRQGISPEMLSMLFTGSENQNWNNLITTSQNIPVHYYLPANESVKNGISNFLQTEPLFANGISLKSGDDLVSALNKDIYAIGFCNLTQIIDARTNEIAASLKIIPIDKNLNGRIDNFENIYENLGTFTRGVWIGKYPIALCGDFYAISEAKPTDESTLAFLTWLTTDGQRFLSSNGFCDLANIEKQSNLLALANPEINTKQPNETETAGLWLIILISFLTVGFIVTAVVLSRRSKKSIFTNENIEIKPLLDENSIEAPKGLYFDKTHTWAFMEKNGVVKVGIDDFLQHITGTLTRIIMKVPGEKIRRGEKLLTINHEGKKLDIYSPVSGTIKEQNQLLTTASDKINTSTYSEGWIYTIEPINWMREIQFMFMAEKYKEWLRDEFTRLKDFFAASVRSNTAVYNHIILQDGGELSDNVLADLGPEVWEDFQTNFINTSK